MKVSSKSVGKKSGGKNLFSNSKLEGSTVEFERESWWQPYLNFSARLLSNRSAQLGILLLMVVVGTALLAPLIAPYPIDKIGVGSRLEPPPPVHLFGTDPLGRDLFSRIVFGAQITLQIGAIALGIAASGGTLIGLVSGFYGGWVDFLLMRIIDIQLAFPGIFLSLIIVVILGPGLTNGMIAVGIGAIPSFARIVRGAVLAVKAQDYILAARATGVKNNRIIFRTILPNVAAPIIVLSTLLFPAAVLAATGLSYIGLGAQPPSAMGALLVDGQVYVRDAPWLFNFPGLAIFITVMGSNLLGNGLRDVLDPQLRGR